MTDSAPPSGNADFILNAARSNYEAFFRVMMEENYELTAHHVALAKILNEVAHGLASGQPYRARHIVSFPPRFGKSTETVMYYLPYLLGLWPRMDSMVVANNDGLVRGFSVFVQELLRDERYRAIFPGTAMHARYTASDDWRTTAWGRQIFSGIGAGLAGRGANILIVDDPHPNLEAADSMTQTEKVFSTFQNDLVSRLDPVRQAVIIISTRQSPMDLIGRLITGPTAAEWKFHSFPICDEDEHSIWPARFTDVWIQQQKAEIGNRSFQSQYLCRPFIKTDNSIDRESWQWIEPEMLPTDGIRWFWGLDPAATTKTKSDYSALARVGIRGSGTTAVLYLDAGLYGRWAWPEAKMRISETVRKAPAPVGMEAVSVFKTAFAELRETLAGTVHVSMVPADGDKLARAWGWLSLHHVGRVKLVRRPSSAKWFGELMTECEGLGSKSIHDDLVDAVGIAYTMAKRGGGGIKSFTV